MNKLILFFSVLILLSSCIDIDCDQLPNSYSSYNDAVKAIKGANFKLHETISTPKSSWIRGASYYSCDGHLGFLTLITERQEYLHSDVPVNIWKEFKNSDSFGSYYTNNIKHKFHFSLN